ncbi:MAG: aspartyl protease family protein [Akkermansiaceae bacterium]|nr:aspartyl protease family protein [Akkermansiaceae bacterium]
MRGICAGFLGLAMMSPASAEDSTARETPEKPVPTLPAGFISFPMKESAATGFRYITIQLNGEDVNMMVDSGMGGEMVVSKKTADALGAKPQQDAGGTGVSGEVMGTISVFKSIKLMAGAEAQDVPMNVLDKPDHIQVMGPDGKTPMHFGIVGATFLAGGRVAFCPQESELLLATAAPPGSFRKFREASGDQAFELSRGPMGEPLVEVEIKGKKYLFLIDTGAQGNTILPEIGKSLGAEVRASNRVVSGVSQEVIAGLEEVDVEEVILGGKIPTKVNFLLLEIPLLDAFKTGGREVVGILGLDWVKGLHGRIDFDTFALLLPADRQ